MQQQYIISVTLRGDEGVILGQLEIPRFNPLPTYLIWKDRLFKFASKLDYHEISYYQVPNSAKFDDF